MIARFTAWCIDCGVRELARRGEPVPVEYMELRGTWHRWAALEARTVPVSSRPLVPTSPDPRSSWVTVEEAAKTLDRDQSLIRRWCRSGALRGDKPDGWQWVIDPQSIDERRSA